MVLEDPKAKDILRILATGALLSMAILAPNAPASLFASHKPWKKYKRNRLRQVIKRMADQELVGFREEGKETIVAISEKGKSKLLKFNFDEMKINDQEDWNGTWKIVYFDIPETKKLARELFRKKLKELRFYQLQKSVFITPYGCKDQIDFLRSILEIGDFVSYLETENIEQEEFLKSWFEVE